MPRPNRHRLLPHDLAADPVLIELVRVRDQLRLEVQRAKAAASRPFRILPGELRRPTS